MRRSQLCINCCTSIENEDPLENALERDMYIHENDPDSDSDYEDDDGNIFTILEDAMADL